MCKDKCLYLTISMISWYKTTLNPIYQYTDYKIHAFLRRSVSADCKQKRMWTLIYTCVIYLFYFLPCFSMGVIFDMIPLIIGWGRTAVIPTAGTVIDISIWLFFRKNTKKLIFTFYHFLLKKKNPFWKCFWNKQDL